MTFEELDTKLSSGFAPFMISLSEGGDNELSVTVAPSELGENRELSDAQVLADGAYYPAKWTHYEIVTQNHIISVISPNKPSVNISSTP